MTIKTEPFILKGFLNNPKYVCGYCRCPLDTSYGIVVSKDDIKVMQPEAFDRGYATVECTVCGSVMNLYFGGSYNGKS